MSNAEISFGRVKMQLKIGAIMMLATVYRNSGKNIRLIRIPVGQKVPLFPLISDYCFMLRLRYVIFLRVKLSYALRRILVLHGLLIVVLASPWRSGLFGT